MKLLIVVPCYNEQEVLADTTAQLSALIRDIVAAHGPSVDVRILYVDDGSKDHTWGLIEQISKDNEAVSGLKLAHNVGHQNALWAGLEYAVRHADAVVSIDADLQDDIRVIPEMVRLYQQGADVVYGVRRERQTDSFFKRTTALAFYRLMQSMHTGVIYNHADFRLLSRRAMEALLAYPERNLFLRGMVSSLGFSSAKVYYDRRERQAGVSKYPFRRMMSFALDGITSFSVRPLQCITFLGLAFMFIALCAIVYGLVSYFEGRTISGWTSIIVSLWFIGGAILVACGIIGEYVGKIYKEVKMTLVAWIL